VIYLALEEKRQEVRAHFRALGATRTDPIYILCATAPQDALARLRVEVARRHPVLIIIDPLFKLVRVPSERGNDYATMSAALEPLLQLARETGAHVLAVHHLGKGLRDDGDAILGSTAIFAAVDTALLLKRSARYRTLSSLQRYGDDLEEITLRLDPDTRDVAAGLPRAEAEQADAGRLILDYLATVPAPATEPDVADSIECRTAPQRAALRALVREGRVARSGRGAKGDPFRYALAREQASPRTPDPAPGGGACSLVPIDTREQGNKRTVPSETAAPKSADSCSRVPHGVLVPGVPVPEAPESLA
jgi:AAA domain